MIGSFFLLVSLAKTLKPKKPLMAFNTWNSFQTDINETVIRQVAQIIADKFLKAGYNYIIIDDGWQMKDRDAVNNLQTNRMKFPSGIRALSDFIHSKNLFIGMYEGSGTKSCAGFAGSFGFEAQDALLFEQFNVDYLKYDFCHNPIFNQTKLPQGMHVLPNIPADILGETNSSELKIAAGDSNWTLEVSFDVLNYNYFQIHICDETTFKIVNQSVFTFEITDCEVVRLTAHLSQQELTHQSYNFMYDALSNTKNEVVFHVCEWGLTRPYLWAREFSGLWRTTTDITYDKNFAWWHMIKEIYEVNVRLTNYSGQGRGFNDPDMLVVGMRGLTYIQSKSHFVLWCFMNAPLIIGADVRVLTEEYVRLLTNVELISINQDELLYQCVRILNDADVLVKFLTNNRVAVAVFNKNQTLGVKYEFNIRNLLLEALDLKEFSAKSQFKQALENAELFNCLEIFSGEMQRRKAISGVLQLYDSHAYVLELISEENSEFLLVAQFLNSK